MHSVRFYFPLSPALSLSHSPLVRTSLRVSRTPRISGLLKKFASTMSTSPAKQNVVIVGGGLAGTVLAKELTAKLDHSKYNLVVVEARPYLVWMLGGARMTVATEKDAMNNYFFNYDKFFPAGKGTVKKAKVQKIVPNSDGTGGELELSEGEVLPYRSMSISTVA